MCLVSDAQTPLRSIRESHPTSGRAHRDADPRVTDHPTSSNRDAQEVALPVQQVADLLGVTDLRPLRPSGQKRVYRARRGAEEVVLKVVEILPPHQAVVLERARREVELLARLAAGSDGRIVAVRSGLVKVGDPDRPDTVGWLEEYIDGQDLTDLLTTAPFTPFTAEQASALLTGLALALQPLHTVDVVHRDLSPGNIRQRTDGTWTLLDPGLARHLNEMSLTGLYQPGTPGYRSPEHVPGGEPQPFSDIYAAGILTYASLTGQLPIDPTGAEDDYLTRLKEQDPPSVHLLRTDLPERLVDIIDRCLQRQPARRYLDATELLEDLTADAPA